MTDLDALALREILAREAALKRQLVRAHQPLVRWVLRRARATGRIEAPTALWGDLAAAMKQAMMENAVAAWRLGWRDAERHIDAARARQAQYREPEGPEPPESYLRTYEGTVDGALYRYEQRARQQMAELTTQSAIEGWSMEQLTREIKALVTGLTTWQAERIARTETMRLWNAGDYLRMEAEDEDLIGYEYSVVMDSRVSHICAPLDGRRIRREELQRIPPLHPHCRTWLLPVWSFDEDVSSTTWLDPDKVRAAPGFGEKPPVPPRAPWVLPPVAPAPVPAVPDGWPADPYALRLVRGLGGSTGAELVEDASGAQFVRKRGASADHLREECACDAMYQAAGVLVPEFRLYDTPSGPVKLARYIDGELLSNVLSGGGARADAAIRELRKGLAADALVANWDVVGLAMDNILVGADGRVWRIDNGGGLRYRAQGARKTADQWTAYPDELWSLRNPAANAQTARVFAGANAYELAGEIEKLAAQRAAIIAAAPADIRDMVGKRLDQMEYVAATARTLESDRWTAGYADGFTRHIMGIRKAGIVDRMPQELRQRVRDVTPVDENGKPFDNLRGGGSLVVDLAQYMRQVGTDWAIIERWMGRQAGNSWNQAPQAVKWFWVQQRMVPGTGYYWRPGGNPKQYYDNACAAVGGEDRFAAAWQSLHAFTYELLGKTKLRYNDRQHRQLRLIRTEDPVALRGYGVAVGGGRVMPRGAHESASVFRPTYIGGSEVTVQSVPHHRITMTYLIERSPGSGRSPLYGDNENEVVFLPDGIPFDYLGTRVEPPLGGGLS